MTTLGRNPHVSAIGSKFGRILRTLMATNADSTPTNRAEFVTQFTRAGRVDGVWRDGLDVLLERVVDRDVEEEPQQEDIYGKEALNEKESVSASGYTGPSEDNVLRLISEALDGRNEG